MEPKSVATGFIATGHGGVSGQLPAPLRRGDFCLDDLKCPRRDRPHAWPVTQAATKTKLPTSLAKLECHQQCRSRLDRTGHGHGCAPFQTPTERSVTTHGP